MKSPNMNRRTFLKVTTVAGGGLLVGCSFSSPKLLSTPNDVKEDLGMWVRIGKDDKITLILPASEMGQQAHTGQAMLVAEELEADWNSIQVVTAPVHSEYKRSSSGQGTGGSSSIMDWWEKLRHVGAGTREMLIQAAAQKWGVPVSECIAKNGEIHHLGSGRRLSYGQLADAATKLSPPDNPTLKSPGQYRFLGKSIPKLHTPDRVNGTAQYGIDVRRPGMLFAAVRQSPVFGGQLKSYDEAAAKAVRGVEAVVPIPSRFAFESTMGLLAAGDGIAVVADTTWHAQKGLEAMDVKFVGGDTLGLNSSKVSEKLRSSLNDMGKVDVQAEKILEVEYEVPFLHHATMESMNCTADVTTDSCEVWVPHQNQDWCMDTAKEVTGFSEDQIQIHTTMLGGSFGRKSTKENIEQALIISKFIQKPVQVIWSREEDTQHGTYRPVSMSRFQVGLGGDGLPVQWERQVAQPSFAAEFIPLLGWIGFDPMTIPASVHDYVFPDHFYKVEGVNMTHSPVELGVPVGAWRAPPNSINVFYTESVMDELAELATAVEGGAETSQAEAAFEALIARIGDARAAVTDPRARFEAVEAALRIAAEEYEVGIAPDGSITELHEYQDALGFTQAALAETEALAASDDAEVAAAGAQARDAVEAAMAAFDGFAPEALPGVDVALLHGAAARVELAALGLN